MQLLHVLLDSLVDDIVIVAVRVFGLGDCILVLVVGFLRVSLTAVGCILVVHADIHVLGCPHVLEDLERLGAFATSDRRHGRDPNHFVMKKSRQQSRPLNLI